MSKDNADILAKLDKLADLMTAEFKTVNGKVEAVHSQLAIQGERIARMEGRLDEQSRILAAMIPTTLAAVPAHKASNG